MSHSPDCPGQQLFAIQYVMVESVRVVQQKNEGKDSGTHGYSG